MHWMTALGQNARILRGWLRIDRPTSTSDERLGTPASEGFARSAMATKPEVTHEMLCPQCLYEGGSVPGTSAVRPIDIPDPNSFSCSICGRRIDP